MKKFMQGVIVGVLITLLLSASIVLAEAPIKLIINGQEVKPDVPPQMINGRVMVPARFVAEAFGAKVKWDGERNAVVITLSQLVQSNEATEQIKTIDELEYDGYVAIRELSDVNPDITYTNSKEEGQYLAKGNITILIKYIGSEKVRAEVYKDNVLIEVAQGIIYSGRTWLPKNLLIKYGFIN